MGPVKIFSIQGNSVFLFANGSIRKVPRCNIQLCESENEPELVEKETEEHKEGSDASVCFEDTSFGEDISKDDLEEIGKRKTRSMMDVERRELERDNMSAFWLNVENSECYDDITVYTVEVPVREHKRIEVVEVKEKELENLVKYDVFEEVDDKGQETVGLRWVITRKEKADGQKTEFKGRLVAKGFQEKESPQSDSPTMLRESLKLFFSVVANEGFELRSIDIRAAFL